MSITPRWLGAALVAGLLAVMAGGGWFYRSEERQVRRGVEADLASIADFKVKQLFQWRAERLGDAGMLQEDSFFHSALARWLAAPGAEEQGLILERFRSLQKNYRYKEVALVDPQGEVLLSLSGRVGHKLGDTARMPEARQQSREPYFSDLHISAGEGTPQVDLVVPFFAGVDGAGVPVGSVLLEIDARDFIYQVTQAWPTPSASAESLFVRRDGDDVLYLNDLRFRPDAALKLRVPLTRLDVPAVMAVLGREGVVDGVDYRGVPVIAVLRAIPDSPWFMATKMDAAEAFAEWRTRAILIVAVLGLLGLALAATLGLVWQQRARYQALAKSAALLLDRERQLRDALGLNEELLRAVTVGIEVFKASGRCVLANEAAASITGGTVEALRQQDFRQSTTWQGSGLLAVAELTLGTGEAQRLELPVRTTFGRDLWLDCSLSSFNASGESHLLLTFQDITQRKQATLTAARLAAIVEGADDAIIGKTLDGVITSWNEGACRIFGYTADEMLGQSVRRLVPDDRLGEEEGIVEQIRMGQRVRHLETVRRSKGGQLIEVSLTVSPVRDDAGRVVGASKIARDITQRRRLEEIVRARLRLLEAAQAMDLPTVMQRVLDEIEARTGSTIGFYHFMGADQETLTLQAWSTNTVRHMCKAEGQGNHYPISKAGVWVDCVRERRPVIHNDYAALAHKKGLPEGHSPILRQLAVPILRGDRIVAIIGVGNKPTPYDQTDVDIAMHLGDFSWEIVERKAAEEDLAKEVERRRILFEQSQDGIVVLDLAGEVVELNQAFAAMLGYSVEEAKGLHLWDWDATMTKEHLLVKLADVAESGATFETRHRRKNGMLLDVEVSASGVNWRGRTLVFAVYRDISLRKMMEARQRRLLDELSRSNTDLEQFAYVASHDLKSPLRAIDSLAGWLQEDLEAVMTGESRKHLDLLRQRTHRMERLLDDLLAYSRAGRVPDDIVQVDVAGLVAEISEMISPPSGFVVRLQPPAPVFATAVTPLRQVLTNLIANAIKHHDRPCGLIEVAVREAGEWFEFTVADDGPGIAPESHERIFGMFQTLRPRDEVEGSGIGLALVRRIVARYGGVATVACREPRGSVFRFQWPKTISTDESLFR